MVTLDVLLEVLVDRVESVANDLDELVVLYAQRVVLLDDLVVVPLGMQINLLLVLCVVEGQLVEATSSWRTLRTPAAPGLLLRQQER